MSHNNFSPLTWWHSFITHNNISFLISSAISAPTLPLSDGFWTPNTWKRGQGLFPATKWIWHMMIGGPAGRVGVGGIIWVPRLCSWTWGWHWKSWGQVRAWCSWSSQYRSGSTVRMPPRQSSEKKDSDYCSNRMWRWFVLSWVPNSPTDNLQYHTYFPFFLDYQNCKFL